MRNLANEFHAFAERLPAATTWFIVLAILSMVTTQRGSRAKRRADLDRFSEILREGFGDAAVEAAIAMIREQRSSRLAAAAASAV